MELNKLTKNELDELMQLFIKERCQFYWLISFEEFIKYYVVKCEKCGEFFVTDVNAYVCENCEDIIEEESDPDWEYFDINKDHYVYGLY